MARTLTGSEGSASSLPAPARGLEAFDWLTRIGGSLGTIVLPFALVLYLALQGGGYDAVIRSEVGIVVWWLVLLGAIAGLLPARRLSVAGWTLLGLFAALTAWTAVGASWSESAERTVVEVARLATYLGVLALALLAQGRDALRNTVGSVAAAIGVVGALALLSRLHPGWFPANETAEFLPDLANRLSYPLNYWNAVAALMVMGVPLMLGLAGASRSVLARSLATAAIPVVVLAGYYTFSRGGILEIAVALVVLLALWPRRLELLPSLTIAAAGSALLIAAASQRQLLEDASLSSAASAQGDEMIAIVAVVCVGVALLSAAITFAGRAGLGRSPAIPKRVAGSGIAACLVIGLIAFLSLGGPGFVSDRWEEFKANDATAAGAERFESASGNGRWEWWQSAADAGESSVLTGIGPGTFEYWWAENGTVPGFVRDAHSLYLETFGELGIVGLALLLGCLFAPVAVGLSRLRTADLPTRMLLAAALASMAVFLVAGIVDWVWEVAVLPVVFILLAAAVLSERRDSDHEAAPSSPSLAPRLVVGAGAVVALLGIGVPLATTNEIRTSQAAAQTGDPADLQAALADAQEAADLQPYAATPQLQQALVLELMGNLDAAAAAATLATEKESTNWRTWLTLARIEAERGRPQPALAAYEQAKQLNPRSQLFANE